MEAEMRGLIREYRRRLGDRNEIVIREGSVFLVLLLTIWVSAKVAGLL